MEQLNKIICGDALEEMRKLPDESIDLILTDPPYGIDYQSNMRVKSEKFSKLENDNNNYRFETYPEFYKKLKENSVAVVFCSWKNYAYDFIELKKLFDIKNVIIWEKGGGGIGDLSHSLLTDYEMAIVCHKGNASIRGKRIGSIWRSPKIVGTLMVHPTEKPINLFQRIIQKFSNENDIILDPFIGSGTTAVAAKMLDRNYIGIEKKPEYVKIAEQRLKAIPEKLF